MDHSTIHYRDGRQVQYPPAIAYAIWLATPGTVLRVFGDTRPVYKWQFAR